MVRERQGGTFVGDDVAIPHVRIKALSQPIVALESVRQAYRIGIQIVISGS